MKLTYLCLNRRCFIINHYVIPSMTRIATANVTREVTATNARCSFQASVALHDTNQVMYMAKPSSTGTFYVFCVSPSNRKKTLSLKGCHDFVCGFRKLQWVMTSLEP